MRNAGARMSSKRLLILCLAVLLSCLAAFHPFSGPSPDFPDRAFVTAVYDGDTIKVRFDNGLEKKVRLIGVSAAEIDDEREEVRFQALTAKRFAFFYLYRRNVKLAYDWELEDKYGRLLAYVFEEHTGLFNRFIIEEGFAAAFLKYPYREDYKKAFVAAEKKAKKLRKGLWQGQPYPLVPANEARQHIGRLLRVEFTCSDVKVKRGYAFLNSADGEFSALIPRESWPLFPEIGSFKGRMLIVTGFLEEYRGQLQILLFFPSRLEF